MRALLVLMAGLFVVLSLCVCETISRASRRRGSWSESRESNKSSRMEKRERERERERVKKDKRKRKGRGTHEESPERGFVEEPLHQERKEARREEKGQPLIERRRAVERQRETE